MGNPEGRIAWHARIVRAFLSGMAVSGIMVGLSTNASGAAKGGAAEIVQTDGTTPQVTGGSATPFEIKLPAAAACQGDTMHDFYLLYGYVVPVAMTPASVTYHGELPRQGTALVSTEGQPYAAQDTVVNTGEIPALPSFSWAAYVHHLNVLSAKAYNFGIACSNRAGMTTAYWNATIAFAPSNSDKGGFTWRILSADSPTSSGSADATLIGVAVAVVVAFGAGGAILLWRRRRLVVGSPRGA